MVKKLIFKDKIRQTNTESVQFMPDYNYTSLVSHGSYVISLSSLTGLTSLVCHGCYVISLTLVLCH